jgi:DNA-binding MarR family transcriptional regulator
MHASVHPALYGLALSLGRHVRFLQYLAIKIIGRYLDVKILAVKIFSRHSAAMKSRDSGQKASSPASAGEGDRAKRGGGGSAAEASDRAARRFLEAADQVDRALDQWAREMPQIETKGASVLSRARRVALESRRDVEANLRRHGLDSGAFDVLAALRRAGEPYALRPTELYRSLMISSGGLTARLDKLEAAGFIRRRAADDDARSVLVELTPQGRRKIEAAFRAGMEIENRMVEGLNDTERAELVRLLRKLTQAMKG